MYKIIKKNREQEKYFRVLFPNIFQLTKEDIPDSFHRQGAKAH